MRSPKKASSLDSKKFDLGVNGLNMYEKHISKPSQELLSYYKNKITRVTKDYNELSNRVDEMKALCDFSSELQNELSQRNEEISRFQQAVSDLQVYLYHEREKNIKLNGELDRFKIKEMDDRKKIEALLTMSGKSQSDLMHFIATHPKALFVPQKYPERQRKSKSCYSKTSSCESELNDYQFSSNFLGDPESLKLQIKSLESQLEQVNRISSERTEAMLKDRELVIEERELEKQRLVKDVEGLRTKLKKTQDSLCECTSKLLKVKHDHDKEMSRWMEERDRLIHTLSVFKDKCDEAQLVDNVTGYCVSGVGGSKTSRKCGSVEKLKDQLSQSEQLIILYQEQVVMLEGEINRLKEQSEQNKTTFRDKTRQMSSQIQYLRNKYEDLDRRRLLEAEGFRTDIRMLKERLKDLEKKLLKSGTTSSSQLSDQQLLYSARVVSTKAQQLQRELNSIKNKISQMGLNE